MVVCVIMRINRSLGALLEVQLILRGDEWRGRPVDQDRLL
jgi:hypothetical protein